MIVFVFLFCVWVSNLDSIEPLSMPEVVVEFAPVATITVSPINPTVECQQLLASWSIDVANVMKEFEQAINLGANNNHEKAYQTIARAHQSYQQIPIPACDNDAIEYHRLIGLTINEYTDAYHAMRINDIPTAHALFTQSFIYLNQANDVFAILRARYEQ